VNETAIAAGLEVARSNGLRCRDPVVLRDAWHVLIHLRPLPIVVRVSSSLPFPEGPHPNDIARELAVAFHAARAGAPVIPPADEVEAAPYRHDGHVVTFWRYIEPSGEVDPRAAGRALRVVHEALGDYEGKLPEVGHPEDTEAMLAAMSTSEDVELLHDVISHRPEVDGQGLNGDAHLWNCLASPVGPLWHDFETACRGPREYDLAALVSRDRVFGDQPEVREALAAYGAHDAELLEAVLPIYIAWVTASMLTALPRRPVLKEAVAERLAWLRATRGR
jgi:hypothetical protein